VPNPGPSSEPRRRGLAVLRGTGFAAAVILGAVAIWLIVTSTSQKRIEIGVLTGLWGLLLGAYSVFGSRSHHREAAPVSSSQEVDLRPGTEVERAAVVAAVAAARREFQAELEDLLRREVQAGLAQELAGLRAEVTALRNELVEKVGGQLRLERIETTRLIGSDLEALQHELRQLREIGGGRDTDGDVVGDRPTRSAGPEDVHDAEIVVERVMPPAPPVVPASPTQPTEPVQPLVVARAATPEPEPAVVAPEPAPEPEVASVAEPEPAPAAPEPQQPVDPFASMPRIRPFTDFELDPIPSAPVAANGDDAPDRGGRHATGDGAPTRSGRRHRADGDDGNDVLARILARESRS
jgi:hypothetical protein